MDISKPCLSCAAPKPANSGLAPGTPGGEDLGQLVVQVRGELRQALALGDREAPLHPALAIPHVPPKRRLLTRVRVAGWVVGGWVCVLGAWVGGRACACVCVRAHATVCPPPAPLGEGGGKCMCWVGEKSEFKSLG